jgi:hypothetical protein
MRLCPRRKPARATRCAECRYYRESKYCSKDMGMGMFCGKSWMAPAYCKLERRINRRLDRLGKVAR